LWARQRGEAFFGGSPLTPAATPRFAALGRRTHENQSTSWCFFAQLLPLRQCNSFQPEVAGGANHVDSTNRGSSLRCWQPTIIAVRDGLAQNEVSPRVCASLDESGRLAWAARRDDISPRWPGAVAEGPTEKLEGSESLCCKDPGCLQHLAGMPCAHFCKASCERCCAKHSALVADAAK